jgi:hypothetical protein
VPVAGVPTIAPGRVVSVIAEVIGAPTEASAPVACFPGCPPEYATGRGVTVGLSSFRAFFPGIVAHKITEAFRGVGRKGAHWVAEPPDSPIPHDDPERRLLAPGVGERPGRQLHRLTPRQRAVLVLRITVGLSAQETAQVLGSSPGAVRLIQHRALNRLRSVAGGPLDVAPGHPGDAAPHPADAADTRPDPHPAGLAALENDPAGPDIHPG